MKLALLLPGYLDSPDYLHMVLFEKRLKELGYLTERLDPCNLWKTGDTSKYTITNYINQVKVRIQLYQNSNPEEIILVGHSMGAFVSIIAGNRIDEVTKIISLCPPPDRKYSDREWNENKSRTSKRDLPHNSNQFRTFEVPYTFVEDGTKYSAKDEVKEIHKPIMIFVALDDVVVEPKYTEQIINNANSPYVVKQPNMGHDFRRSEKECNIVMQEIEKFLTK